MSISKELFLAILALDSYNRGYDAGLGSETDGLGSAAGTVLGNATIIDVDLPVGAEASGFYAIAYDTPYGTVISYRGTDNPNPLDSASDIWNGWTLGAGFPQASQGDLSIRFFEAVTNKSVFAEGAGDGVVVINPFS